MQGVGTASPVVGWLLCTMHAFNKSEGGMGKRDRQSSVQHMSAKGTRFTACRLFLSPYDLTPTLKNVHNKFSVKYYLNLVLVDEEDRRYFKQQEIQLYREHEGISPPAPSTPAQTSSS